MVNIQRLRLMIIEDNVPFQTILRVMLGSEFLVATAENGSVGYRRAREFRPQVVLVDLDMPVLDGVGFLKELRHDPELSHVPAIVLTNAASAEAVLSSVKAGANDYLIKTEMTRDVLFKKITRVLNEAGVVAR